MAVDLDTTAIDPEDPVIQSMLEKIQCNILKSHGRDFTAHIFLQFTGDADQVKEWIRNFTNQYVISAQEQLNQSKAFKEKGIPGGLVGAFFLSAEGYSYLGYDVDLFEDKDKTFRRGMKHQGFDLLDLVDTLLQKNNKDPNPDIWEAGYRQTIHAMALLAQDNEEAVRAETDVVVATLSGIATALTVEYGNVLRNEQPAAEGKAEPARKGQPIEHFGYVDGRSNPIFFKDEIAREVGGTDKYDPSAPLKLVLVPDPHTDVEDSYGSYFVFRKLEQNVEAFNLGVVGLASTLGINPDLAGALVVGRFKDGTPVTLQETSGLGDVNNFDYASTLVNGTDDSSGNRCPFHAHIRKVNPRGTTPFTSLEDERGRRIVRRGIPYGKKDDLNPPRDGVGLLFMCYQRDIHLQWEFMQRTWSDNPNFPRNLILPHTGDDPIIGQDDDNSSAQKWPTAWDSSDRRRKSFEGYVNLVGGEFFFAPSLSFLRAI